MEARFDDLSTVVRPARASDGSWLLPPREGWTQGRGYFGGLVVGAMVHAALETEEDSTRPFRTVAAEIVGAVDPARPAILRTEVLRRGTGLAAIEVKLRQSDEVLARATVTLARHRTADRDFTAVPAPGLTADAAPLVRIGPPLGPEFAVHFDFRPLGPFPFSGATEATCQGFVAPRDCTSWGPPEWTAMADCYWSGLLSLEHAPRPMSTISFLFHALATPARGAMQHRARVLASQDGYATEVRELFDSTDTLVGINTQVFAIIK